MRKNRAMFLLAVTSVTKYKMPDVSKKQGARRGCVQQCGSIAAMEALYPPWNCRRCVRVANCGQLEKVEGPSLKYSERSTWSLCPKGEGRKMKDELIEEGHISL